MITIQINLTRNIQSIGEDIFIDNNPFVRVMGIHVSAYLNLNNVKHYLKCANSNVWIKKNKQKLSNLSMTS